MVIDECVVGLVGDTSICGKVLDAGKTTDEASCGFIYLSKFWVALVKAILSRSETKYDGCITTQKIPSNNHLESSNQGPYLRVNPRALFHY